MLDKKDSSYENSIKVSDCLQAIEKYRFIFIHIFTIVFSFFVFRYLGLIELLPNKENILKWDANWYNSIRLHGYTYSEQWQSNSGFFPLFPYFWRVTQLDPLYISLLNGFIGLLSIFYLAKTFDFKLSVTLLCVSLPSSIFMYVPYTESLFFLFSTIFLVGLKNDKKILIAIGLFVASIIKPITIFFIPSIIFMELLMSSFNQINLLRLIKKALFYLLFSVIGILLVEWIQYVQTGVWFAYFKAQSKYWDRTFSFPGFPLTALDWEGEKIIWIDSIAFLIGLIAIILAFKEIRNWVNNKLQQSVVPNKVYLFSLIYLSMILFSILFFNPKMDNGSTNIIGINRYMFVSPFIMVFLNHHFRNTSLTLPQLIFFIILTLFTWLLFGSYEHIQIFFLYGIITIYFIFYYLMMYSTKFKNLWIPIYCLNVILQLWFFDSFLKNYWVG
jgi:hypothetical protein